MERDDAGELGGSAAMGAEAVHSFVDGANQALLIVGHRRSGREADDSHPFGHGAEIYFWALVVAGVIFAIGGGATIVEGVYASREGGLAYPLLTYVKLLLLQQWYGLSDEGLEALVGFRGGPAEGAERGAERLWRRPVASVGAAHAILGEPILVDR